MNERMSVFVLILSLVFLIVISCGPARPENGIELEEEVFDFGVIGEGIDIEHDFIFTNTGKQTLEILNVKTECNCTVTENWDKSVASGKSGKISTTFITTGYQGDISKNFSLITNVPGRETIVLTIKGNVKPPIAMLPRNVDLGIVYNADKEPLAGSFEIHSNLDVPLKILDVGVPGNHVKYTLTTIEENMKYRVDFTVDPPFTGEQMIRGKFLIKTDNEKYPEITPSYSYYIPPPVDIYPINLNIDLDQLKSYVIPYMTSITIQGNMEKPIQIEGLKLIGGRDIEYQIVEAERYKIYQIIITIPLDYVYRKDEKVSLVFSVKNDPKKKQYNIPIQFYKTEAIEIN